MVQLFSKAAAPTHQLGKFGEEVGVSFLRRQGYRIMATNYRNRCGEIDIVARDQKGNTVFVEVKTRSNIHFGHPVEAVNIKKQRRIIRTALCFLKEKRLVGCGVRFLVLGIEQGRVETYEGGFMSAERYTI